MPTAARGDQMLAGAGGALLVIMFFSWYGISGELETALAGVDTTATAWQAFEWIDIVLAAAGVVAILPMLLREAGQRGTARSVAAGLGGLAAFLVAYRMFNEPGPDELLDIKFGAYLGLIAAIAVASLALRADEAS